MRSLKPIKRPKLLIAVLVGLVGAGATLAFNLQPEKPKYETAEVTRGDLEVTISASGKIQPKNYVDVGAQVSGQLKEFMVEVGGTVGKGDLLARIDETLAMTKVDADRAQLNELKASLAQQQASLELSRANAERADMLYKAEAISKAEFQAAMADRKIQAARLDQLTAQIQRQNSTLEADLASLGYTKIYAPMAGTIVSRSAAEGQTLNANQTTPTILRIADLSLMTVEAEVSEADVLRVGSGQKAYFTTLGNDEKRWPTSVRQVLPQPEILNDVVLYKVLLDIDNKDGLLKPEMTAQVFFVSGEANDAVLAPVAALSTRRRGGPAARDGDGARAPRTDGPLSARASEGEDLDASDPAGAASREKMRAAMAAHPEAERMIARIMVNGAPELRPVLVGLKTRVQAQILYGLEPGDIVVTGEPAARPAAAPSASAPQTQRPPGMGRRGPG
ncbi:MAG: efflux RND transporter periplasmic adaptor subunit [Parvularculaceae bacterium]